MEIKRYKQIENLLKNEVYCGLQPELAIDYFLKNFVKSIEKWLNVKKVL